MNSTKLDQLVSYFKENFNDNIYYCLQDDGRMLISAKPGLHDTSFDKERMFIYDDENQTFSSLFNKKMKFVNPEISRENKALVDKHLSDNFIVHHNYPSRLYASLKNIFYPLEKLIDDNIYDIKVKLNEIDGVTTISNEIVFSMFSKKDGRINFVIKLDDQLNLTDIVLHDKGLLFNKYADPLTLEEKKRLFTVVLGSLVNNDFAETFNKDNVDYSESAFDLLTILEF